VVADLFALPDRWQGAFDLVIEHRTLQSLPVVHRCLPPRPGAVDRRRTGLIADDRR